MPREPVDAPSGVDTPSPAGMVPARSDGAWRLTGWMPPGLATSSSPARRVHLPGRAEGLGAASWKQPQGIGEARLIPDLKVQRAPSQPTDRVSLFHPHARTDQQLIKPCVHAHIPVAVIKDHRGAQPLEVPRGEGPPPGARGPHKTAFGGLDVKA